MRVQLANRYGKEAAEKNLQLLAQRWRENLSRRLDRSPVAAQIVRPYLLKCYGLRSRAVAGGRPIADEVNLRVRTILIQMDFDLKFAVPSLRSRALC